MSFWDRRSVTQKFGQDFEYHDIDIKSIVPLVMLLLLGTCWEQEILTQLTQLDINCIRINCIVYISRMICKLARALAGSGGSEAKILKKKIDYVTCYHIVSAFVMFFHCL